MPNRRQDESAGIGSESLQSFMPQESPTGPSCLLQSLLSILNLGVDPIPKALDLLLTLFESPRGFIGALDGGRLCILASRIDDPAASVVTPASTIPRSQWQAPWDRALLDPMRPQRLIAGRDPTRPDEACSLAAPIVFQNEVLGVVCFARKTGEFSTEQIDAIPTAASLLAPFLAILRLSLRVDPPARETGQEDSSSAPLQESQSTALLQRLENLERELTEVRNAAGEEIRRQNEFIANLSYEIRRPMTAILGFTDLLLQDAETKRLPHDWVGNLLTVKRNGEHLLSVINGVMDLARIEAGQCTAENTPFSVPQLVVEVVSLMRVRAHAKGLQLEASFATPIFEKVQGDPTRLRQILVNLVSNAVRFTESGKIRLNVSMAEPDADPPLLQFDVVDSGIGIHESHLRRLFEPFAQPDASTTRGPDGSGLGLAVSRKLAQLLGGALEVKSQLGRGSVFSLTVPAAPCEGAQKLKEFYEAVSASFDPPGQPPPKRRPTLRHRILLVEDGQDNQRLISFHLRRAGAEVVVADDGQSGFDKAMEAALAGEPFDVVVMDIQMPVMDGYEATRRLRAAGFERPILALTAHAQPGDREKCLQAGCDDYAAKPFEPDRLIAQLASLVAHSRRC